MEKAFCLCNAVTLPRMSLALDCPSSTSAGLRTTEYIAGLNCEGNCLMLMLVKVRIGVTEESSNSRSNGLPRCSRAEAPSHPGKVKSPRYSISHSSVLQSLRL